MPTTESLCRKAFTAGFTHQRWDSVCSSTLRGIDWDQVFEAYRSGVKAGMARDELKYSS